jgi:hypothetical protein
MYNLILPFNKNFTAYECLVGNMNVCTSVVTNK